MISNIPFLGSGLGYRRPLHKKIYENVKKIDFLEIISESFFEKATLHRELEQLSESFVIIPHGVSLSIGSQNLNMEHLVKIKEICRIVRCPYYSEHLCITKIPGLSIGHLGPIWYSKQNLKTVVANVKKVQDYLEMPLVLENITFYFTIPNSDYELSEFINEVVKQTGCGILLDLANLGINSHNHDYDPYEFINKLPLDNIVQIHIAGGTKTRDGHLVDSHNKAVSDTTWKLLSYLANKTEVKAILLEHDKDFPEDFSVLLNQIQKAREIGFLSRTM